MATIQVLGIGCSKCGHLLKNAEQAVKDLGGTHTVEKISDIVRIIEFSPSALPALAIAGKVITSGALPTPAQIQELIKTCSGNSSTESRSSA